MEDNTEFFYSDVGQTVNTDFEEEDEGMPLASTMIYSRKINIEGYQSAAEIREKTHDGTEVKTDSDTLYALGDDGQVDIWTAYPSSSHMEDTDYEEGPDKTKTRDEISDERVIGLLGGE